MRNAFYRRAFWRKLRRAVIARAGGKCQIPGCTAPSTIVDHIIPRKRGGTDTLDNLRALCARHDNAIKEDHTGKRRQGSLAVPGCDAAGLPLDPNHAWHKPRGVQS